MYTVQFTEKPEPEPQPMGRDTDEETSKKSAYGQKEQPRQIFHDWAAI